MNLNLSESNILRLEALAKELRLDGLEMSLHAAPRGAHFGGSLSSMEIMAVLYGEVLRLDPKNPTWEERDRFLVGKQHCLLSWYPALSKAGFIPHEELSTFAADGSRLTGHPRDLSLGLEINGGSLGLVISAGVGMAIAAKEQVQEHRVYVLVGDGELNEGSCWEGFMAGAHFGLNNLTVIVDRNHISYGGKTEDIMALGDLGAKLSAFGWHVIPCNGHDVADLLRAFHETADDRPTVIIADTVKGKGVSFIEGRSEWHQHPITAEQYEQAKAEMTEVKS